MDEGVKLHEGIRSESVCEDLLGWVGGAEFVIEVGEVGEGKFTRV